jgi:histidinol-phosphate/aromatic aminotransferase/cobyric acid decarboxylase-like protein
VLARRYEVKVENVIAGSGSEGLVSNIIRTFLGELFYADGHEDEVLTAEGTFVGFRLLANPAAWVTGPSRCATGASICLRSPTP